MKRVLLSAFACKPGQGSEGGNGWNWAEGLAKKGFEVHCITSEVWSAGIETRKLPPNLSFSYVRLPFGMERLYGLKRAKYLYYLLWQWKAYKLALRFHRVKRFDVAHHVTFGSLAMGSFMYKLGIPFIFGPAGGGQVAPVAFKEYFGGAWVTEEIRSKAIQLMLKLNPACRDMLKNATVVLVSNQDTLRAAANNGARDIVLVPDSGLPDWFFPDSRINRTIQEGSLKLLWVGRLLPLKGALLLLDVMKALKNYPGITLTVVGDGVMRQQFLEAVERYELHETVKWNAQVRFEEIRGFYATHDVFFFTSLRDSCPAQLIEAMAFGLPVVTLDLHGQGLIVDVDRGFKCACGTPDSAIANLKAAILSLYRDPALLERLSAGASSFAVSQAWDNKIDWVVRQFYR